MTLRGRVVVVELGAHQSAVDCLNSVDNERALNCNEEWTEILFFKFATSAVFTYFENQCSFGISVSL